MNLKIWRPTTKEEREKEIKETDKFSPSKLHKDIKCKKITLQIMNYEGFNCINSIAIDNYFLKIEDFENLDYIQIFES